MKRVFLSVVCILLAAVLFASPDRVRMISIGLDYNNSPDEEMVLYGTLNDAYQMTAAVQNVMEAKGVEFENVMMIQEGKGDFYIEITVISEERLDELKSEVESILLTLNTDSVDAMVYPLDDDAVLITDRVTVDILYDVYEAVAAIETGDDEAISFDFFDIKDTPTYPSADNVLNQILLCQDLDYDDLLIVYYSGHGGSENAFTNSDMENLLKPFVDDGRITEVEKDAVLDLNVILIGTVMDRLTSLGVDDETVVEIGEAMEESEDYYKTGVLATAYTYDNYWSDCTSLEMYMVYTALSYLKCDCVLILDSCFSGYAAEDLSEYFDESEYDHAINIEVMSASTNDEYSQEYAIDLDDGEWEMHGAFTSEVLSKLGWKLSSTETTDITVPFYTMASDGSVIDISTEKAVNGYTSFIPERQTATQFFASVVENWDAEDQHPQNGESTYLLYFIP